MRAFLAQAVFPVMMTVIIALVAYGIGRSEGHLKGYLEGVEHAEKSHQCHTSDFRPCAFGPGIIGIQVCGWGDQWKECKPDPRFLVERQ